MQQHNNATWRAEVKSTSAELKRLRALRELDVGRRGGLPGRDGADGEGGARGVLCGGQVAAALDPTGWHDQPAAPRLPGRGEPAARAPRRLSLHGGAVPAVHDAVHARWRLEQRLGLLRLAGGGARRPERGRGAAGGARLG